MSEPTTTPGGPSTWPACSSIAVTSSAFQLMPLGNGESVPSTHRLWPSRDTFHMPGPGCAPVTTTASMLRTPFAVQDGFGRRRSA